MSVLLIIVHIIVCIALIMIVLLQTGKGADIGAAFGGGSSQTLFGATGASTFLGKATTVAAIVFMLTSLSLAYISGQNIVGDSVVMDAKIPKAEEKASATSDKSGQTAASEDSTKSEQPAASKDSTAPVKSEQPETSPVSQPAGGSDTSKTETAQPEEAKDVQPVESDPSKTATTESVQPDAATDAQPAASVPDESKTSSTEAVQPDAAKDAQPDSQ